MNQLATVCQDPKFKFYGTIVGGVVITVYLFRKLTRKAKKNYKENVVILHQLPRGLRAPR